MEDADHEKWKESWKMFSKKKGLAFFLQEIS